MVSTLENPYIKQIQEKIKEEYIIPIEEKEKISLIKKEISELQELSDAFIKRKISECEVKVNDLKIEKTTIKTVIDNSSSLNNSDKKKLIKKISELYKESVDLYLAFRELKKQVKGDSKIAE